jgi:hypothetical protein
MSLGASWFWGEQKDGVEGNIKTKGGRGGPYP